WYLLSASTYLEVRWCHDGKRVRENDCAGRRRVPARLRRTRHPRPRHQPLGHADPGVAGGRPAPVLGTQREDRRYQREDALAEFAHPGARRVGETDRDT